MSMDYEEELRREKSQRVRPAAGKKSKRSRWIAAVVVAAMLLAVCAWFLSDASPTASTPPPPASVAAVDQDGKFRIPLADLAAGRANFFEYRPAADASKPIRFFAVKGGDGAFRAALDACEVCHAARRGYEQAGDKMVCRKCGLGFPSEVIDDRSGGCHPIRVERVIEGDALVVRAADLEQTSSKYAIARQPGRR